AEDPIPPGRGVDAGRTAIDLRCARIKQEKVTHSLMPRGLSGWNSLNVDPVVATVYRQAYWSSWRTCQKDIRISRVHSKLATINLRIICRLAHSWYEAGTGPHPIPTAVIRAIDRATERHVKARWIAWRKHHVERP